MQCGLGGSGKAADKLFCVMSFDHDVSVPGLCTEIARMFALSLEDTSEEIIKTSKEITFTFTMVR